MQKEEKEVKELELAVYTDLHIDVLVKKLQEKAQYTEQIHASLLLYMLSYKV